MSPSRSCMRLRMPVDADGARVLFRLDGRDVAVQHDDAALGWRLPGMRGRLVGLHLRLAAVPRCGVVEITDHHRLAAGRAGLRRARLGRRRAAGGAGRRERERRNECAQVKEIHFRICSISASHCQGPSASQPGHDLGLAPVTLRSIAPHRLRHRRAAGRRVDPLPQPVAHPGRERVDADEFAQSIEERRRARRGCPRRSR